RSANAERQIADVERQKAEARAEDLRKLSNSLLSEIDDAIQRIPGSTAAHKLLVSIISEHLSRAAKDAFDDPQLQLDLANAYTRLANVQASPYEQNIGDVRGALTSLDQAVSIAAAAVRRQPANEAAVHALGLAEESRSEVLFGIGKVQEAVATMRLAAGSFAELASRPSPPPDGLIEAARAYAVLGDELGQPGMENLNDPAAALAAYQRALEFEGRLLRLDPRSTDAALAIAGIHMKTASLAAETDPASALPEYRKAMDGVNALPEGARKSFGIRRLLAVVLQGYGAALEEAGRYGESLAALAQAKAIEQPFLAADPNDLRAVNDLGSLFDLEAQCYEERAQEAATKGAADGLADAANALKSLSEVQPLLERVLKQEPDRTTLRSTLGLLLIRISLRQQALHRTDGAQETAERGVAMLKAVGKEPRAQSM